MYYTILVSYLNFMWIFCINYAFFCFFFFWCCRWLTAVPMKQWTTLSQFSSVTNFLHFSYGEHTFLSTAATLISRFGSNISMKAKISIETLVSLHQQKSSSSDQSDTHTHRLDVDWIFIFVFRRIDFFKDISIYIIYIYLDVVKKQ